MEEIAARHRKEAKALEGEKRAAIKKGKSTKGKKAKEEIAAVEAEYDAKLREMEDRHQQELSAAAASSGVPEQAEGENKHKPADAEPEPEPAAAEEVARQKKLERARRKREAERLKESERERQIAEETANSGPSPREVEMQQILLQLTPLRYKISEVPADGNCLYRAVAAQCGNNVSSYHEIRAMCADTLAANESEFAPFCELTDDITDYQQYVESVRSSTNWGGHLELRALSIALQRPVHVYSMSAEPLVIDAASSLDANPVRLSYHLHYYSLGEHYNTVVAVSPEEDIS